MALLTTALKAARAGLYVFPVEPGGKRPVMTPRGRLQWGEEATRDEGKVTDWWTNLYPTANIGVAAKPSKLLIVDCDVHEGQRSGEEAFCDIAEDLGVPFPFDTLTVATPSGGAHRYFGNPQDVDLCNAPLVRGAVDIRANGGTHGGYVVAPGSTRDGRDYVVSYRARIAPAPPWLLELCRETPTMPQEARPAARPYTPPERTTEESRAGVVNRVRYAQDGNRNNLTHWAACVFRDEGIHISEAERDLVPAAMEAGLPRGEVLATISSAYRGER